MRLRRSERASAASRSGCAPCGRARDGDGGELESFRLRETPTPKGVILAEGQARASEKAPRTSERIAGRLATFSARRARGPSAAVREREFVRIALSGDAVPRAS